MIRYTILFFFILFSLILIFGYMYKYDLDDIELFNNCKGCIDENGICKDNVKILCKGQQPIQHCLSFIDKNTDKLHTPCDKNNVIHSFDIDCMNCKYCKLCIDRSRNRSCISKKDFNCVNCPYSQGCRNDDTSSKHDDFNSYNYYFA